MRSPCAVLSLIFVNHIQAVLDAVPAARDTLVLDTAPIHNMSFSGAALPLSHDYVKPYMP